MAKSLTQEMASEIARIAQTRVVEVDRVRFHCGEHTLQMVKTTHGVGYLLNDRVLFSMDQCTEAARAFFLNVSHCFYVTDAKIKFGTTDVSVANISAPRDEEKWERDLQRFAKMLRNPPLLVD